MTLDAKSSWLYVRLTQAKLFFAQNTYAVESGFIAMTHASMSLSKISISCQKKPSHEYCLREQALN